MQNLQLYIFLIIIGFSVLQWVIRKLNEQSQVRKLKAEQERRRMEALRTGRPDPTTQQRREQPRPQPAGRQSGQASGQSGQSYGQTDARARLREIQARREAQLEALRRQRSQQAQPTQQTRQPEPAKQPQPSRSPQPPRPQRVASTQDELSRSSQDGEARRRARAEHAKRLKAQADNQKVLDTAQRRAKERGERVSPEEAALSHARRERVAASRIVRKMPQGDALAFGRDDLRRAIVMNEILSPPLALRKDAGGSPWDSNGF